MKFNKKFAINFIFYFFIINTFLNLGIITFYASNIISNNDTQVKNVNTPCFDYYNNKIQGLTCTKEVTSGFYIPKEMVTNIFLLFISLLGLIVIITLFEEDLNERRKKDGVKIKERRSINRIA